MKAFCFTLTILCAVQGILAYPRPDFAINGQVSGSVTVKTTATGLTDDINKVGNGTVTLNSGYQLLTKVKNALEFIGDEVVRVAGPLGSSLNALAADTAGPINATYDGINTTITNIETLLVSGLNATIANITTDTGIYIEKQFVDAFRSTKTTLVALRAALDQLKSDVQKAKTAAGSANPIPSAIIRTYIPAKTVNAVITQIRNLRARIPLITYIIDSSLDNLKMVDIFIIDMQKEVVRGAATYVTSISGFQMNLEIENTDITSKLTSNYGPSVSAVISSIKTELEANTDYNTVLQPKLTALSGALESIVTESAKINTSFTTYSSKVPLLITNLNNSIASSLCEPIQTVSKVQIANGGFSDFCFSKYSPRVFSQVSLTIDAFDVCFEKEIMRLMNLAPIVQRIATQISFNTADLLSNLQVCLAISDLTSETNCLSTIAPYYTELAAKVTAHTATAIKLVDAETKASYNRLGACLFSSLSVTTVSATEISLEATACLINGPE
uniref:DUF725 domain-containing protein n=1 Tax=Anopheles christyi TaxID=43041 RepID=A0A182JU86_9DIPT